MFAVEHQISPNNCPIHRACTVFSVIQGLFQFAMECKMWSFQNDYNALALHFYIEHEIIFLNVLTALIYINLGK